MGYIDKIQESTNINPLRTVMLLKLSFLSLQQLDKAQKSLTKIKNPIIYLNTGELVIFLKIQIKHYFDKSLSLLPFHKYKLFHHD